MQEGPNLGDNDLASQLQCGCQSINHLSKLAISVIMMFLQIDLNTKIISCGHSLITVNRSIN